MKRSEQRREIPRDTQQPAMKKRKLTKEEHKRVYRWDSQGEKRQEENKKERLEAFELHVLVW